MKNSQKIGFLSFILLIVSCSTKKDAFLNRNFHALTTKYNVLYNGNVAFNEGIKEINSKYEDDFWELLPIEPLKFERDNIKAPNFSSGFSGPGAPKNSASTQQQSSPFDTAEEKAVKAIQKHSMNIYGKERNRKIDEAYLLLGKSRYYTERSYGLY